MNLSTLPHAEQVAAILTASDAALKSAWARRSEAKRKRRAGGKGGGRPRTAAPRCPCQASTLKRAHARGFDCCKRAGLNPALAK